MRVENFIAEGKCFVASKLNNESILSLKKLIMNFMRNNLYVSSDPLGDLYGSGFLSMNFFVITDNQKISNLDRFRRFIGVKDDQEILAEKHFLSLRTSRGDVPFKVSFLINYNELNKVEGFLITIRSEPVALQRKRQLGINLPTEEFEISDIQENNKEFIREIMLAIGATVVKEPICLVDYMGSVVCERLEKMGFGNVSELIKNGRMKVNKGDTNDGLTDLRSAWEIYVKSILEKKAIKPNSQEKVDENIKLLCTTGCLSESDCNLILDSTEKIRGRFLGDAAVHKREKINLISASYLFALFERSIEFLMDKAI